VSKNWEKIGKQSLIKTSKAMAGGFKAENISKKPPIKAINNLQYKCFTTSHIFGT